MPPIFRPWNTTSFGHLSTAKTDQWRSAFTTGIPHRRFSIWTFRSSDLRTTEQYRPPGGETHARPWRPRPATCRSATTTVPSPARSGISSFAVSFVDSTASNRRISRGISASIRSPNRANPDKASLGGGLDGDRGLLILRRRGPAARGALPVLLRPFDRLPEAHEHEGDARELGPIDERRVPEAREAGPDREDGRTPHDVRVVREAVTDQARQRGSRQRPG